MIAKLKSGRRSASINGNVYTRLRLRPLSIPYNLLHGSMDFSLLQELPMVKFTLFPTFKEPGKKLNSKLIIAELMDSLGDHLLNLAY
jgi:hypothetical protein